MHKKSPADTIDKAMGLFTMILSVVYLVFTYPAFYHKLAIEKSEKSKHKKHRRSGA